MDNKYYFKKVDTFRYNNKKFCKFINSNGKLAFLVIDKSGKYYYPTIEDLAGIIKEYELDLNVLCAMGDDDDNKLLHFIPKVWVKGAAQVITMSLLLSACGPSNNINNTYNNSSNDYSYVQESSYADTNTYTTPTVEATQRPTSQFNDSSLSIDQSYITPDNNTYNFDNYSNYTYNENVVTGVQTYNEIYDRIRQLPDADDSNYYKWTDDYYLSFDRKSVRTLDSRNYSIIFGYDMPSRNVLYNTIDMNSKIPSYYKQLLKNWVDRWLTNYPGSDLTVLNENLKTVEVRELNSSQLALESISASALASYMRNENAINVNLEAEKDERFEEIFYHEITHAASNFILRDSSGDFVAKNFVPNNMRALYTEEALDTLFTAYENPAKLYPLFVNYYRMITNDIDYTGQDYLNHSVRELAAKIDYTYGDICSGDNFLKLIENTGTYVYGAKTTAYVDDIYLLNTVIIKMYIKSHGETSFEEIYEMINKDITDRNKYDPIIGEQVLRTSYEQAIQELGQSK